MRTFRELISRRKKEALAELAGVFRLGWPTLSSSCWAPREVRTPARCAGSLRILCRLSRSKAGPAAGQSCPRPLPTRPPALTLFGRRVVNAPPLGGSEIAACQKRFGGNRAQNGAEVPVLERVMRGSW